MILLCCCDTCGQQQMDRLVEHMAWGDRITWRCVETRIAYAWREEPI